MISFSDHDQDLSGEPYPHSRDGHTHRI